MSLLWEACRGLPRSEPPPKESTAPARPPPAPTGSIAFLRRGARSIRPTGPGPAVKVLSHGGDHCKALYDFAIFQTKTRLSVQGTRSTDAQEAAGSPVLRRGRGWGRGRLGVPHGFRGLQARELV